LASRIVAEQRKTLPPKSSKGATKEGTIKHYHQAMKKRTIAQELLVAEALEKLVNCNCSCFTSVWRTLLLSSLSLSFTAFTMVLLLVVNLTCSQSNAVFLLNLACLVFLFVFMLLALTIVSLPLFVLLVYSTLVTLLFLVNGLVLASSFSFAYYSLSQHSITNRLNFDVSIVLLLSFAFRFAFRSVVFLPAYHIVAVHLAAVQFLCLLNFATQPALLNTGINRLANAIEF
jgi:hypothetical protein